MAEAQGLTGSDGQENVEAGKEEVSSESNSHSGASATSSQPAKANGTPNSGVSSSQAQSLPPLSPNAAPSEVSSKLHHISRDPNKLASSTLRHVTRVSKRAAMATKKQIWDSDEATIVAAQSAVDQWEHAYGALRSLMLTCFRSAQGLYGAAKTGAAGLEHGLLLPVRDWILLPAFMGAERLASETSRFIQSDQVDQMSQNSVLLARQVPFVGENILAPMMCISADVMKKTWEIAQYPIPSPAQVRDSVGFFMAGTKWAISVTSREVILYVQRADANITRTLCHTQWKVLGSGPYATLDERNKADVINHLCERYLDLKGNVIARYELAAHIRAHNRPLYNDLVKDDLLRSRGGDATKNDEWLSLSPNYRCAGEDEKMGMYLLPNSSSGHYGTSDEIDPKDDEHIAPLWFYLPNENGEKPGKETPWKQFNKMEQERLEEKYQSLVASSRGTRTDQEDFLDPTMPFDAATSTDQSRCSRTRDEEIPEIYQTESKWYSPDVNNDVLVDERRHAVSFIRSCRRCRQSLRHSSKDTLDCNEICSPCCSKESTNKNWIEIPLLPPSISMVVRPTMWRYYGPGDEVRRATWLLDTQKHGLQPFGEDAQAVLEDAWCFLKWAIAGGYTEHDNTTLLTVQVPSPNESEVQLIQFSSLARVTAIGKGLGGAISLFKKRVYRGVCKEDTSMYNIAKGFLSEAKDGVSDAMKVDVLEDADSLERTEQPTVKIHRKKPYTSLGPVGLTDVLRKKLSLDIHVNIPNGEGNSDDNDLKSDGEFDDNSVSCQSDSDQTKRAAFNLSTSLALPFRENQSNNESSSSESSEIAHLVLVVHGIGEMLRSLDIFGIAKIPTIVECCGFLRDNHQEVLKARLANIEAPNTDDRATSLTGRVEYLPVEWHEAFSLYSRRRTLEGGVKTATNVTMDDVSLRTIPQLRQFANETMMDILYFMDQSQPTSHHDTIVDIVVAEMNRTVSNFRKLTGFRGDISVMGHSLGSIISWDILNHQVSNPRVAVPAAHRSHSSSRESSIGTSTPEETSFNEENCLRRENPELIPPSSGVPFEPAYPQLEFAVDNFFMLGAPVAIFLLIRNKQRPLPEDFSLPGCPRVFNIFHPYDPVAYRIEPLIDPRNTAVEPKIMTHWQGGYRFQYQTKRLWKKIVDQTWETQQTVIEGLEASIAALGLLDGSPSTSDEDVASEAASQNEWSRLANTGNINQGNRIDYMLQEREIENATEYVSALAAHSCYWLEKDLSLFIARQLCLREIEKATGEVGGGLSRTYSTEWK